MLALFRRIRRSLIEEGRLKKYLVYAFGEIVLIVLGILVALQINNWNVNNGQIKLEEEILTELRENLQGDVELLGFALNGNQQHINATSIVLRFLQKDISYDDSLEVHFGNLIGTGFFTEYRTAYENLESVGVNIIRNNALRQQITSLYSSRYKYVDDLEKEFDVPWVVQHLYPAVMQEVNTIQMWSKAKPRNINAIQENYLLQETLKMSKFNREVMLNVYEELLGEVKSLIKDIEAELNL